MTSMPPAVALWKPQAPQPAQECSEAGSVVASMQMLVSPAMTTGCLPPRLHAVAYICISAQDVACPAHGEQPACGLWTLMRVRPPLSVRIPRAAAFLATSSVKLSTSCSATYLLLTAVMRPPRPEVEVDPVFASQLLKKGVYPLSRSAASTCISCARVAIPVSWTMLAKRPSWGSMPVMRCSSLVQAARPQRRLSVSRRNRSGGTRPLRRLQDRSRRASPAAFPWSQLFLTGIAAGSAGAARSPECAGAMGCGEPAPRGAHKGARLAGMDPWWAATLPPRAAFTDSSSSLGAATRSAAWRGGWALGVRRVPRG